MKIIGYYDSDNKEHWLGKIKECEWSAGQFLHKCLKEGTFKEAIGESSDVLMLTEGDKLISFCTLAEKDDIQPTELTPWIGFVYTFPQYRGHRYSGKLLSYAEERAREKGFDRVYISTNHTGLYEGFGYELYAFMKDMDGDESRVYIKKV
ncbi:MAG: GNAT family N-acetyltransferase [Clostridia bacterium]|nr:GNAT family N-acetyltransferase [Clostridia bacterium]